jgi:hypothetical protein
MSGRFRISRLKQRLDSTFSRAPLSNHDIEIQADFAKYLCILVSGYLENAIIALIVGYSEKRSAPEVASYVERQLDRWTNPNTEKICQLFGSFSPDWRTKIEGFLVDYKKDSINSLVALRHKIAHGESVGTTMSQVKGYYNATNEVVEFLADLVDP